VKKFMITGGLAGFLIGLAFGLIRQSAWPSILWRASVVALVLGILLRWWGRIWVESLRQAGAERTAAQARAAETSAPSIVAKS
jgi:hypothetical protein